ncbi:hypothetical protein LguiA_005443 [Lonicera macranthoides]
MGRQPCCEKVGLKKGPWTCEEDKTLINFILTNGHCCWRALPKLAGLKRCGKSCRLRWTNYLRPDLKRGLLSESEENLVIQLHSQLGNRWSKIASNLPGRTDNEIKNHWNTHIKKKLKKMGIDPLTHKPLPPTTPIDEPKEQLEEQQEVQYQEMDQINEKENDTSLEYSSSLTTTTNITHETIQEDKSSTMASPLMEFNINGFCIDEVPLVEPHEILVPCGPSPSTSSSSSSSLSSSSSNKNYDNNNIINSNYNNIDNNKSGLFTKVEDLEQALDWHCDYTNDMSFWDFDFNLDFFINGDSGNNVISSIEPLPLSQYQRMVMDEESWNFKLL